MLPIDFDKLDESVQNMISQLQIDVEDLKREAWLWRLASGAMIVLVAVRLIWPDHDTMRLLVGFVLAAVLWLGYRKYRSWWFRRTARRLTEMVGAQNPFDRR